ncbi:MAG: hypothetical protein LCH87_08540 [Actinobacteria bacterium]|jgi:hypothetical protein|nr:hypothetical protein [Actinomycetota bacterium]
MLTLWNKTAGWMVTFINDTRTMKRGERGAINSAELLGLIIIVLAVLALVGPAVADYIQGKLAALH